jgi:hypothetical protein
MAWPNDDYARRVGVAKELDRQSFWKSVYVACKRNGTDNISAKRQANDALLDFDLEFKDTQS